MKIRYLVMFLGLLPCLANAAPARSGAGRTGMRSGAVSGVTAKKQTAVKNATVSKASGAKVEQASVSATTDAQTEVQSTTPERLSAEDCREEYRTCMDEFCELDESEGGRCACSDNIKKSKSIIQSIQKIQEEAEKLYTEGVEKERLGAKAKYIFGESEKAKSRASRIDLTAWINGTGDDSMAADEDIGDNLYSVAADSCEDILKRCDKKIATKEEQLYLREVTKDCKAFDGYLAEQKKAAESNKNTAAAAVRSAKLEMFGTTNKYNRGECLLAYRACIADKGGCGVQFENCLDASLLQRRANACENVLDQCMATKNDVLADWAAESKMILADAAKYSDKTMRLTCNAKTQNCLEEGCSTSTDTMCLSDINVAAGICPIIDECNAKIPGFKTSWQGKLGALRTDFCQNDVTKCLQDKCGVNYDAPQCTGKGTAEIAALCPKSRFLSCKNEKQFNILVGAVLLKMNYQMLENCKNYYADALGRVCGTDMDCLTDSTVVSGYTKYQEDISDLKTQVEQEAENAVNAFFKRFETEKTITECASAEQPSGGKSLKDSMFVFAKQAAVNAAKKRYVSDLNVQHLKLARQKSAKDAEKACLAAYKPETRPEGSGNVTYIKSVSFEPSMMNCHVCRVQRVCQVGGESESAGALKGAAGGLAAGASAGSMLGPWGTAIGAVIGGVGGGIMGANSSGEKEFCQEIESCEDVNTGSQI